MPFGSFDWRFGGGTPFTSAGRSLAVSGCNDFKSAINKMRSSTSKRMYRITSDALRMRLHSCNWAAVPGAEGGRRWATGHVKVWRVNESSSKTSVFFNWAGYLGVQLWPLRQQCACCQRSSDTQLLVDRGDRHSVERCAFRFHGHRISKYPNHDLRNEYNVKRDNKCFEYLAHFSNGIRVNDGRVLFNWRGEEVRWQFLGEPLVLSVNIVRS